MEIQMGMVSGLSISDLVDGQYGEQLVYRATFLLDGAHKVRLQARRRPSLRDGDLVAVAGAPRGFGFSALAYANLTTGEEGNVGMWEALLGAALFLGLSIWWEMGQLAYIAAAVGIWCLISSARIALARQDLRYYAAKGPEHLAVRSRTSSDA